MKTKTTTAPKRIRFVYDSDHVLENPSGTPLPGPESEYLTSPIHALIDPKSDPQTGARRIVDYAEYCKYWGNPNRHVVIGAIVETQCGECGHWETAASLWGIDFMDDDRDLDKINIGHDGYGRPKGDEYLSEAEAMALPGYLREVAKDLFCEADTDVRRRKGGSRS